MIWRMTVKEGWRGRFFEDFEVGDVYEHALGRTITLPRTRNRNRMRSAWSCYRFD
jgi:acyl dehydratase